MLQEPPCASLPRDAPTYLLHGLAPRGAALRLRVRAHQARRPPRLDHRCVRPVFPYQSWCPAHARRVHTHLPGGTDICSLFAGMNAALPVVRGEIQCRMLGMAVTTYTPAGTPCAPGEPGELVCTQPFPCQPVGFWPLPGFGSTDAEAAAARERYHQAYFAEFEGVWCELELFLYMCVLR